MKALSAFVLLLPVATVASVLPRQTPAKCCFTLSSVGTVDTVVKENNIGELRLLGSFQQGFFCLDPVTQAIQDGRSNTCFFAPDTQQFQCFTGLSSPTKFGLALSTSTNGSLTLLTYDGQQTYLACPAAGPGTGLSYNIFSAAKVDKVGCKEVLLVQTNANGVCVAAPVPSKPGTTTSCQVSNGSPSIPATRVASGPSSDLLLNLDGKATISSSESTIFEFQMPASFVEVSQAGTRKCALQFRLPTCTQLPDGYPCFDWSGLEQQKLGESGMSWSHVFDTLPNGNWKGIDLVQLKPGEPITVGTFDCGVDLTGEPRIVSWLATAVRDWSLYFSQAGIGPQEQWKDGVGAFVVGCDQ